MSVKQEDTKRTPPPDLEVHYSAKFLQQQSRERRNSALAVGLILPLILAPMFFAMSLHAYRTHSWINFATRNNAPLLLPPIVGIVIGALCLLYGIHCLWEYFASRK